MTPAKAHAAPGVGAVLLPLFAVFALVLLGLHPRPVQAAPAVDPVVEIKTDQAHALVVAQRHLPGVPHADFTPFSDLAVPETAGEALQRLFPAALSPARHVPAACIAIRILPPVRGPPAA